MELFVRLLGSECGNLCLKGMALSGIYLCGAVPVKILPWLQTEHFLNGLLDKGRYREFLAKVPVHVVVEDLNALYGIELFCEKAKRN